MKKPIDLMLKTAFYTLLLIGASLPVSAQKLKEIQETGVWAPANVKVDAKLTEWGDSFQAFNKTNNIYYTIANDDNNVYLVIKSSDQATNNKIIGGGINFTINTANKKNVKDAFTVVFPQIDYANLRNQVMSFRGGMGGGGAPAPPAGARTMVVTDRVDVAGAQKSGATANNGPDSAAIASMRKKAVAAFKEIKLIGFKDIPDSVISVYNEYGLKGFVDFDDKGSLIMEMCIPLKYMNIKPGSTDAFTYNLKLNGINIEAIMPGISAMMNGGGMGGGGFGGGGMGGGNVVVVQGSPGGMGGSMGMPRGMGDIAGMLSPTDFWGKYVLAKKAN